MKKIFLLLLLAFAFGQCDDMVSGIENSYGKFLYWDVSECVTNNTYYSSFAALGEQYGLVANCFEEDNSFNLASSYYKLSAENYRKAFVAVCSDNKVKMNMLLAQGKALRKGGFEPESQEVFNEAVNFYEDNPIGISPDKLSEAKEALETPNILFTNNPTDIKPVDDFSIVPYALAAVILAGIILIILFLRRH